MKADLPSSCPGNGATTSAMGQFVCACRGLGVYCFIALITNGKSLGVSSVKRLTGSALVPRHGTTAGAQCGCAWVPIALKLSALLIWGLQRPVTNSTPLPYYSGIFIAPLYDYIPPLVTFNC